MPAPVSPPTPRIERVTRELVKGNMRLAAAFNKFHLPGRMTLEEILSICDLYPGATPVVSGSGLTGAINTYAVWGYSSPTFNLPDAPTRMYVVSSDAADNIAGTGCQKVKIAWLDIVTRAEYVTEIDMNGTTEVDTTCEMFRIQDMWGSQFGTGKKTAGTITAKVVAPGTTVHGVIRQGYTKQAAAKITVPYGYYGVFFGAEYGAGSASVNAGVFETYAMRDPWDSKLSQVPYRIHSQAFGFQGTTSPRYGPEILPEGCDVFTLCQWLGAGVCAISAGIRIGMIPKEWLD